MRGVAKEMKEAKELFSAMREAKDDIMQTRGERRRVESELEEENRSLGEIFCWRTMKRRQRCRSFGICCGATERRPSAREIGVREIKICEGEMRGTKNDVRVGEEGAPSRARECASATTKAPRLLLEHHAETRVISLMYSTPFYCDLTTYILFSGRNCTPETPALGLRDPKRRAGTESALDLSFVLSKGTFKPSKHCPT